LALRIYEILNKLIFRADVEFVFEVMGSPGEGIDAVDLGDALRALNLNPTLALIEKMGGTKKRNEKKIKLDEFLPIYSQVKKEKEREEKTTILYHIVYMLCI